MNNILDYEELEHKNIYKKYLTKNLLILTIIGIGLGIGSRLIRPIAEYKGIHIEFLIVYFIIVLLIAFSLPKRTANINNRFKNQLKFIIRNVILWFGLTIGWLAIHQEFDYFAKTSIIINSIWCLATIIVGVIYIQLQIRYPKNI